MASAWGSSWGVAWGNSWGDTGTAPVVSVGSIRRREAYERLARRRRKELATLAAEAEQVKQQIAVAREQPRPKARLASLADLGSALETSLPMLASRLSGLSERIAEKEAALLAMQTWLADQEDDDDMLLLLS